MKIDFACAAVPSSAVAARRQRSWTHILTTNNIAAQPPQASPVSQAHATYTHGQDAGDLAARARELGLERRAALLEASRQRHSLYGGTLKSTRLRLAVLASFDPDLEEEDWQRAPSTPTARRPLDRSPSWLEDVEARREQSGRRVAAGEARPLRLELVHDGRCLLAGRGVELQGGEERADPRRDEVGARVRRVLDALQHAHDVEVRRPRPPL